MKKVLLLMILAIIGTSVLAVEKTKTEYKEELLEKGYLFGCNPANWSLVEPVRGGFNYAVLKNRTDIMELEVKAGLDPLSCSKYNAINAITTESDDALELLLKYGYEPNKIMMQHTLLSYAVYKKNRDAVKILINNGADVNLCSSDSFNVLNMAIKKKQPEIVKMLLDAGAKPNKKTYKLVKKTKSQEIKDMFDKK